MDEIHAFLDAARAARKANDGPAVLAALDASVDALANVDADSPLHARVRWRLAKARFDFATADVALDAISPLLERDDPFRDYDRGLKAVEPLARAYWDAFGYGDARIPALWQAWSAAWAARGDAYLAAVGKVQGTWQAACRGDQATVDATVNQVLAIRPRQLANAPTRHPRAVDASQSAWFLHLDISRMALRCATWRGDERAALDARDLLLDAAEDADIDARAELWIVEPLAWAAHRFGWSEDVTPLPALLRQLPEDSPHRALGEGLCAALAGAPPTADPIARAYTLVQRAQPGPEWWVAAALLAGKTDEAAGIAHRFHVVFEG